MVQSFYRNQVLLRSPKTSMHPNESDWNIGLLGHWYYGNPARIFPKELDWNKMSAIFLRESSMHPNESDRNIGL